VVPGEKLTERQALEALLIPSGNNIGAMLAGWDAGSQGAFVAEMNAQAGSLGLRSTRYADASGADPATVSTAGDQFVLTLRALQIPAFRQIVAMPQVTLPVAGVVYNVNSALGHDGIVGVKTGSSSPAGGCLAFAAIRTATAARSRSSASCSAYGQPLPSQASSAASFPPQKTFSAASAGTWNTPTSSGRARSWGAFPAGGRPGRPRSRPRGSP